MCDSYSDLINNIASCQAVTTAHPIKQILLSTTNYDTFLVTSEDSIDIYQNKEGSTVEKLASVTSGFLGEKISQNAMGYDAFKQILYFAGA